MLMPGHPDLALRISEQGKTARRLAKKDMSVSLEFITFFTDLVNTFSELMYIVDRQDRIIEALLAK